ncbi:UDP-N-acetyl glucosamine 2-epimerase, partial [Pirellulaceae bacterium]|nr:UDP-N-acetyl glucosamine 2-epimerase [Pirellulaceae bacterium]
MTKTKKHLAFIVGARPNFMKVAPILHAIENRNYIKTTLIHTGQHYDPSLSDVFFEELEIKRPEISLGVGSGSHGSQTGKLIIELEKTLVDLASTSDPIDRVVVVGDVNSTMAATLAAVKLNIPVAHVEAGLRSFDRTMPEEINRLVTDSVCDLLLASEPDGVKQLQKEGHPDSRIHLVGNVMIDTLLQQLKRAKGLDTLSRYGLEPSAYCVVTLHRPSNVDDKNVLNALVNVLIETSGSFPVVFPVHPRTQKKLAEFGLLEKLNS